MVTKHVCLGVGLLWAEGVWGIAGPWTQGKSNSRIVALW